MSGKGKREQPSGEALDHHREALLAAQKAQEMAQQYVADSPALSGGAGSADPIALAQLEALHRHGAMTDEEFEAAKARLEGE